MPAEMVPEASPEFHQLFESDELQEFWELLPRGHCQAGGPPIDARNLGGFWVGEPRMDPKTLGLRMKQTDGFR
jgi:hypothetical protein